MDTTLSSFVRRVRDACRQRSKRATRRVARHSPGLALALVHLLDRIGLLEPGPTPEEIAGVLDGPVHPRVLQQMVRSARVTRAKSRALAGLGRMQLAGLTRLHGAELLRAHPGRPTILIFWHLKQHPAAIAAALHEHGVPIVVARAHSPMDRIDPQVSVFEVDSPEGRRQFLEHATARLREGGTILVAADGLRRGRGLEVRLFGRRAWFARSFVVLARTTGARVLPVVCPYYGTRRIDVCLGGPLMPDGEAVAASSAREADERLAQRAATWLEDYMRRHPEHMGALVHGRVWSEESRFARGTHRRPS